MQRVLSVVAVLMGAGFACSSPAAERPQTTTDASTESKAEKPLSPSAWRNKLAKLRKQLYTDPKAAQAEFAKIDAPKAVRPLTTLIMREKDPQVRKIFLETLAQIGDQKAIDVLVRATLQEVPPLAKVSLDLLKKLNPKEGSQAYIKLLKQRREVNQAAYALSMDEFRTKEAVQPLINALITNYNVKMPQYNVTMRTSTGCGIPRPRLSVSVQNVKTKGANPYVLATLRQYTGVNYGFDQRTWQRWYAKEREQFILQPPPPKPVPQEAAEEKTSPDGQPPLDKVDQGATVKR